MGTFRLQITLLAAALSGAAATIAALAVAPAGPMLVVVGLAAAAGAAIGTFLVSAKLANDLPKLASSASAIANGQLNAKIPANCATYLAEMQNAIEKLSSSIKEKQGAIKGILEGLPVPYLMVDAQERTVSTNQATMDMLQIDQPPSSAMGRTLGDVFYNDPTRPTAVGKSINNGERFVNLEVAITGHKGRSVDVLANVFPLYDLDGECIGGFCLYLDMTEIKDKERQITAQNETIAETAERAETVSEQTARAAAELSERIDETTNGAREQQRMTAQSATAMGEMSETVMDVARNAADSAQSAAEARDRALAGSDIMSNLLNAMNNVEQRSVSLRENLTSLGEQADSIGSVMDVISDIADQTNLLALNAAIEAARAGDAGRGFAVVADEVRKLAEKTTQATKEVGDAVERIQSETKRSATSMAAAGDEITQSGDYAKQAGEALEAIVNIVDSTADQVQTIAAASEEQSAAVEQISSSMQSINDISDQSADSMMHAHEAITELSELSAMLREIIGDLAKN